jgi:hypothetical protein
LAALIASLLAFLAYWIGYKADPATNDVRFAWQRPWDVLWFIGLMLSRYLGISYELSPLASTWLGCATLTVLIALLALHAGRVITAGPITARLSVVAVVLIGFTLLFALFAALGRMATGVTAASQSSRYATLMIPAFLGLYLHLLSVGWLLPRAATIAALTTLMLPWPLMPADQQLIHIFTGGKQAWKVCYLSGGEAQACQLRAGLPIYPSVDEISDRLAYLKAHRLNLFADQQR